MLVLKPHLGYDYLTEKLKGFGFTHRESISDSRYIYRLKRHIIQESIYGVDIDSSAIDIARLRLWLSLVVDEDDLDPIETLPNLDYKIVAGNSLIGLPDGSMKDLKVEAELEKLKEKFYDITDEKEKKALRQKINTKIRELLDSAEQFAGYKIDFDFKLFFSEVWREKGGFDVVIGNPPKRLEDVLKIKDGIDTGDNVKYVSDIEISGWKKLIGGSDVNRWKINKWRYVNYGKHLANPRDPDLFENDKIVIRETGDKIIATLDKEGFFALSTLYSGYIIDSKFSLKSILGLLHSEIIHFLMVLTAFGRTKGAFTKTRIFHYYSLPVKNDILKYSATIDVVVDYQLFINSVEDNNVYNSFYNSLLDGIFYSIFFPKQFKDSGKQILQHLENLKPINDSMSEEEKLAIIQAEFERLYDDRHPVKFAIETLDSIEEVRIIKEALK
jgi:hypothetical protein